MKWPLRRKATSVTPLIEATLGNARGPFWQPGANRPSMEDLLLRYGRWVHRCVTINAQAAANVAPKLFTIDGGGTVTKLGRFRADGLRFRPVDAAVKTEVRRRMAGDTIGSVAKAKLQGNLDNLVEIDSHPILDLLNDVNPWEEGFGYREGVYTDLQIFGRHYDQMIGNRGFNPPRELWRMDPTKTRVIPSTTDFVSHFEYGTGPTKREFPAEDVLWFKLPDPSDPWGGLGPLEAWLKSIDADFAIAAFQEWTFQRGGAPDWMVIAKKGMQDKEKDLFRKRWRKMFGRLLYRQENVSIVDGDIEMKELSAKPKEMEFSKGKEISRDEICQAFGVPKALVTSDDVNLANAREGSITHMRTTIWPMIRRNEDRLNQRFLPRWSDRLVLVHQNPIPEDREIRIQERDSKLRSGYSVNEVRAEDGEEAIDDPAADVPMMQAGLVPVGGAVAPDEPDKPETEEPTEDTPALAGDLQTTPATVLNGAQVVAATAIVQSVVDGVLPIDSARGQLIVMFNLSPEQADLMLAGVEDFEKPKPAPVPPPFGGPTPPDDGEEPAKPDDGDEDEAEEGKAPTIIVNNPMCLAPGTDQYEAVLEKHAEETRRLVDAALESAKKWMTRPEVQKEAEPKDEPTIAKSQAELWLTHEIDETKSPDDVAEWERYYEGGFADELAGVLAKQARSVRSALRMHGAGAVVSENREFGDTGRLLGRTGATPPWGQKATDETMPPSQDPDAYIDATTWADEIGGAAKPPIERVLGAAGSAGIQAVGVEVSFDLQNDRMRRYIADVERRVGGQTAGTWEKDLRKALQDGIDAGENIGQITKRVEELTGTTKWRAERVARTETAFASTAGVQEGWVQSGVVSGKKYVAAPDCCEFCTAMEEQYGEVVTALDRPFKAKGDSLTVDGQTMTFDYAPVDGAPVHPHCLLPGTPVSARGLLVVMTARYDGVAVELVMASGRRLSVTGNHKLLTPDGFVAAQSLGKGDYVIGRRGFEWEGECDPDDHDRPALIEDVVASLTESGRMASASVPSAPEYLHGDGRFCDGDIDVVAADSLLRYARQAPALKHSHQLPLCAAWSDRKLAGLCDLDAMLVGLSLSAHGVMGSRGKSLALSCGCSRHADTVCLAPSANVTAVLDKPLAKVVAAPSEMLGQCLLRFAGLVSLDQVVEVNVGSFVGHVYDLQTESGLYIANGVLSSNCRCPGMTPVLEGEA